MSSGENVAGGKAGGEEFPVKLLGIVEAVGGLDDHSLIAARI
jgi:hypothetical protein